MSAPVTRHLSNARWEALSSPRLSVLIPFHQDNPAQLVDTLARSQPGGVEIILFDDGVPDLQLNAALGEQVAALDVPVQLISSRVNHGRSGARNRLAKAARGTWLLFLDADMDISPDFLTRWITHTQTTSAGALFGGFEPVAPTASTRVHAALAEASDVHTAAERNQIGAVAVCSSNLAVRRDLFEQAPFDEGFSGWGWEDVDWALSASAKFDLDHVDNPARHGGLEPVGGLLKKFGQSGPNFARLLDRHPAYAQRPGAKLAKRVRDWRMAGPARIAGNLAARLPVLPVRIRVLGLKLFRAGIAAEAL